MKEDEIDTRERIVSAAAEIIRTGGTERPSVRAVAARAGVGASTLRHHFPTQRALLDAALAELYAEAMPDTRIRDTSVPAHERLTECLWQLLEPFRTEQQARSTWQTLYETFIAPDATEMARSGYVALARQMVQRVHSWLSVLADEGALAPGDLAVRANLLIAVIDGLSVDRALPPLGERRESEAAVLRLAVDTVLGAAASPR